MYLYKTAAFLHQPLFKAILKGVCLTQVSLYALKVFFFHCEAFILWHVRQVAHPRTMINLFAVHF